MIKKNLKNLSVFALFAFMLSVAPSGAEALQTKGDRATVKRTAPQALYDIMTKSSKSVVVVDVRTGSSFTSSPVKIKGALRFDVISGDFEARYKELPKNKQIVLYCT